MKAERILTLDISTKTGWAIMVSTLDGVELIDYGQDEPLEEPIGVYPSNYIEWAYTCFGRIMKLVERFAPEVLVIEETSSGSKSIYSQKILEYIHFLVAKFIRETGIQSVYLLTEQWRRETGCKMSDDEKERNKEVRKYKKKNDTKIAYDTEGKRIGLVGRKHVNVRRANEVFGEFLDKPLRKKDEDTADSLLLGYCYHLRRMRFV